MRSYGDILLIACYELGHQPFSLAMPLAFLRRAGYDPVAVDTSVQPLEDGTIRSARLVAIAIPMHTAARLGVQVARRVRRLNPQAHIAFCGLYAHLNEALLVPEHGDSVLAGEYEAELVALAQAVESGTGPIMRSRAGDKEGAGRSTNVSLSRLDFPAPDRSRLPDLHHYAHFRIGERILPAGYVEATRGCLHTCLHCPITPVYGGRFFALPRSVVLEDIRAQVAAGAKHITFGDPDFLNGPRHSMAIARAMHDEFPELTFDATIKVEHILEHPELFAELKALGCAFIVSAFESFSDRVLRELGKGHTQADVGEALRITREAGIVLRPTFVAFTPWTTLDDYLDMLEQVERLGLIEQVDPVQYSIRLLIPPQSALLTEANRVSGWLGDLDAAAFTYRWTHPDPRMDALYREVSAAVERSARQGENAAASFDGVREVAYNFAGRPIPLTKLETWLPAGDVLPGLTESWFC